MLLLFGMLDGDKPLSGRSYRSMRRMLEALGRSEGDPEAELDAPELLRLGQTEEEAEAILRRLRGTAALENHLDTLERLGITALTRISPEYPRRLRERLGENAPMLLYCAGDLTLLQRDGVSLVGSRKLREPGRRFSSAVGQAAARQDLTYVSGGAVGADTAGFRAAINAGGSALVFVPDSLQDRLQSLRRELDADRTLLVSEGGFDLPFSAARAYSRNRLIHAMGQMVFVAQSDYGSGGTWQGVTENLKQGWSPVYVCDAEPEDPGARGLMERGCVPVSVEDLSDFRRLTPSQTSLY